MLDMLDGHWQVSQGALGALPQRGSGYKLASLLTFTACSIVVQWMVPRMDAYLHISIINLQGRCSTKNDTVSAL